LVKRAKIFSYNFKELLNENDVLFQYKRPYGTLDKLYGHTTVNTVFKKRVRAERTLHLALKIVKLFMKLVMRDVLINNLVVVLNKDPFFALRMVNLKHNYCWKFRLLPLLDTRLVKRLKTVYFINNFKGDYIKYFRMLKKSGKTWE
jgi:hypothetical protein